MSDFENDPDLEKFENDPDDIRPIDISGGTSSPRRPAAPRHGDGPLPPAAAPPENDLTAQSDEVRQNIVKKGDYIDLTQLIPSLKEITVGAGWELKNVEGDKLDIDLSCFLIDKTGQTRVDEDFVFYNQLSTLEGAVKHLGDSRTGDGEGDDEAIFLDLNSIPFDVINIALILSIYDDSVKGWHFGMVKDLFLRLIDSKEGDEILRIRLNEDDFKNQTAIHVGTIIREGPKWFFNVFEEPVEGGLMAVAKKYGIIVREDTG